MSWHDLNQAAPWINTGLLAVVAWFLKRLINDMDKRIRFIEELFIKGRISLEE